MTNSTTRELTPAFYSYVSYVAAGVVVVPANLVVAFAILRYTALRRKKEYFILMGLFFADALNMMAYICGGTYRIYKFFTHPVGQLVTTRYCMGVPHVLLWSFCEINAQLMLIVISVDRLISVAFPLRYLKLTRVYAHRMVASSYGFTIFVGSIGLCVAYNQPQIPNQHIECFYGSLFTGQSAVNEFYRQYQTYIAQSYAFISVLIFALVPPVYAYQKHTLLGNSVDDERRLAKQRKITISMSISCICTLLIFTIPYRLAYVFYEMGYVGLAYAGWAFTNNNSMANVIIYNLRHRELHMAIKNLFVCKEMPAALHLWTAASNNKVAPQSNRTGTNHK